MISVSLITPEMYSMYEINNFFNEFTPKLSYLEELKKNYIYDSIKWVYVGKLALNYLIEVHLHGVS